MLHKHWGNNISLYGNQNDSAMWYNYTYMVRNIVILYTIKKYWNKTWPLINIIHAIEQFNFHEHLNLTNLLNVSIQQQPSWMSECDKSIQYNNMKSTLMNVTIWQRHCCLSHWNIYFHECRNATSTLMSVTMWHQLWWMS